MKTSIASLVAVLSACFMFQAGAAQEEVTLPLDQPLAVDEIVCVFANDVIVDFVEGKAGQEAVSWCGWDAGRRVNFSTRDQVRFEAVPLRKVETPSEDEDDGEECSGCLDVTFSAATTDREQVVEFTIDAPAGSTGPCALRLSIDLHSAMEKTVEKLPHSFKWSVRGLRPGPRAVTCEVFDAERKVGTSSLMLEVKEKE